MIYLLQIINSKYSEKECENTNYYLIGQLENCTSRLGCERNNKKLIWISKLNYFYPYS